MCVYSTTDKVWHKVNFKQSKPVLNLDLSFSEAGCLIKATENSLFYYLTVTGGEENWLIAFRDVKRRVHLPTFELWSPTRINVTLTFVHRLIILILIRWLLICIFFFVFLILICFVFYHSFQHTSFEKINKILAKNKTHNTNFHVNDHQVSL